MRVPVTPVSLGGFRGSTESHVVLTLGHVSETENGGKPEMCSLNTTSRRQTRSSPSWPRGCLSSSTLSSVRMERPDRFNMWSWRGAGATGSPSSRGTHPRSFHVLEKSSRDGRLLDCVGRDLSGGAHDENANRTSVTALGAAASSERHSSGRADARARHRLLEPGSGRLERIT